MSVNMKRSVSFSEQVSLHKEVERLLDKVDDQRNSIFRLIQKIMKMTVKNKSLSDIGIEQLNTVKLKLRAPVSLKVYLPKEDRDKMFLLANIPQIVNVGGYKSSSELFTPENISRSVDEAKHKLGLELDTLEKMSHTINGMTIDLNLWSGEIVKYDLSSLNEYQIETLEKFGDKLFDAEKYLDLRMTDMGRLENSEHFRNLDKYFPV